jgi:quercetin dioxygenase-like cupin family protein
LKETAKENDLYRKVLFTGPNSQLVIMALAHGDEIGLETHDVDEFIYVVDGEGVAISPEQRRSLGSWSRA